MNHIYDDHKNPDPSTSFDQYIAAATRLYGAQKFTGIGQYQKVRGQGGRHIWVESKKVWVPLAYAQMERVDET